MIELSGTNRAALCYLAVLPLAVLVAFFASGVVGAAVTMLPRSVWSSDAVGLIINVVPPLCVGLGVFGLLASWLRRRGWFQPTSKAHFARSVSLYLLSAWCASIVLLYSRTNDFGLWAQIPVWTGLAAIGGLGADLLAASRARRVVLP